MRRKTIALLMLGMLIGGTGTTLYAERDLGRLHDRVISLQQENDALNSENILLSQQVENPTAKATLNTIKVDCTTPADIAIQAAVKQRVLQSLSFLQGKPLDVLLDDRDHPAQIIEQIINQQFIIEDKRKFRLRVTLVIITHDELYLKVAGQLET